MHVLSFPFAVAAMLFICPVNFPVNAGKLKSPDNKWIEVKFEPPVLTIGTLDFKYGGQSEVKVEITYVDEKIRLGKGSRGSVFVFQRR